MEPPGLSERQIAELARHDSATVANAIDAMHARVPTEGFTSVELRCLFPELPPSVGYAVTCTDDSSTLHQDTSSGYDRLYEAIEVSRKPVIVVFKSIGDRLRSLHMGEVMAATMSALGAVAVVTDGGVRDLSGVRERVPGFQMFALGAVAGGGSPRLAEVNVTVSICGLTIEPGDLLHGDENGVVSIPASIAEQVAARAAEVSRKEGDLIDFVRSPGFTLAALRERRRSGRAKHTAS